MFCVPSLDSAEHGRDLGFRVWGSGFRVQSLGWRVESFYEL